MRMTDIKNKIHELIESAYRMGYEDGKNLEYDLGLNDAWECARKMMLSDEDGGIALSDILKIFGMTQYSAIKRFSASEAIAKIKEYEEKQKRTCDTCQYGGHTLQDCEDMISRQAVIKHLHNEYHGMISDESMKIYEIINMLKEQPSVTPQPKTGGWIEHFDESGKWYECDQCHTDWGGPVNYCPNCGAKMERSDKE